MNRIVSRAAIAALVLGLSNAPVLADDAPIQRGVLILNHVVKCRHTVARRQGLRATVSDDHILLTAPPLSSGRDECA